MTAPAGAEPQGLPGGSAAATRRVDVDPAPDAVRVGDDRHGHRHGRGGCSVDGGEVQAELQLGGAGLGRGRGQDAEVRGEVLPASVTALNVSSFFPAC
jgi:hypothetical protein